MEDHQIEDQPFLIKVGDWVCGEGGYGQVTQIYHEYYEEYSDFTAWNAGGKNVGDYKKTWAIMKYFCRWDKVRRNATDFTSIFPDTKPIVEGDARWDLIQKFIKENPEKYLAYQKYKPKVLEGHIHIGYDVGPRFGDSHTQEFYIELFEKIREDLPERFTFADLMEIAQRHQCPFRVDKPTRYGCVETMSITLFYEMGEYQDKRKLFYCLGKHILFSRLYDVPLVIPKDDEIVIDF